jgi:hypothetical protein
MYFIGQTGLRMTLFKNILMILVLLVWKVQNLRKDNTNTDRRIKDERNGRDRGIETDRQREREIGWTDGWIG